MTWLVSLLLLAQWTLPWPVIFPGAPVAADKPAEFKVVADLAYKSGDTLTDYERERCRLDLYLPTNRPRFATILWLHGGGLTSGNKNQKITADIARSFAAAGIGFAAANYRLSPKATYPGYIEDATAAFAWTRAHIAEQGGDPGRVFVAGHSAGGYLTAMLGLDPRYLRRHGLQSAAIAGLIPVSGQMMTHFTVRKERGLDEKKIIADEAAPIYHVAKETPPILILMGDHDWPARAEENLYFVAAMKVAGNQRVTYRQIKDRNHGTLAARLARPGDPGREAILGFIQSNLRAR